MRLEDERNVNPAPLTGGAIMPRLTALDRPKFPSKMVELVHDCLEAEKGNRPCAEVLWRRIREEVGSFPDQGGLYSDLMPMRMQKGDAERERIMCSNPGDIYASFVLE